MKDYTRTISDMVCISPYLSTLAFKGGLQIPDIDLKLKAFRIKFDEKLVFLCNQANFGNSLQVKTTCMKIKPHDCSANRSELIQETLIQPCSLTGKPVMSTYKTKQINESTCSQITCQTSE